MLSRTQILEKLKEVSTNGNLSYIIWCCQFKMLLTGIATFCAFTLSAVSVVTAVTAVSVVTAVTAVIAVTAVFIATALIGIFKIDLIKL